MSAGFPLMAGLTSELRNRLPRVRDENREIRTEFPDLFDAIVQHDPEVATNYERFLEWIGLLRKGQVDPFRKLTSFNLDPVLVQAAAELAFVIAKPIRAILRDCHQRQSYQPDYLAKLGAFVPEHGHLDVFTLNYDLCVEDACAAKGINITTGFCRETGHWTPELFGAGGQGINLYKLHGSLNWTLDDNLGARRLIETYPPEWEQTHGELLLGPGIKLQPDDPFVTLYYEFHRAVRGAKVCVAIGCSFQDDHVREPLKQATQHGLTLINVGGPRVPLTGYVNSMGFEHYRPIRLGAQEALENSEIGDAVREHLSKQNID